MPSYVIQFNRRTRKRAVRSFPTSREAMDYRLELEGERLDSNVEIAALTSPSIASLQRTHARYFTGEDISDAAAHCM